MSPAITTVCDVADAPSEAVVVVYAVVAPYATCASEFTSVFHEMVAPVSFGTTLPLLRTGAPEVLVADVDVPVVDVPVPIPEFEGVLVLVEVEFALEAEELTITAPDMPMPPGAPWNWQ